MENTDQLKEAEQKHYVEERKTPTFDFPAGGVGRLKNSTGDLNIEAWDNPNVEITTILSTQTPFSAAECAKGSAELAKVSVKAERKGNELVITTSFPRHRGFPPSFPWGGVGDFIRAGAVAVRSSRLQLCREPRSVATGQQAGRFIGRKFKRIDFVPLVSR